MKLAFFLDIWNIFDAVTATWMTATVIGVSCSDCPEFYGSCAFVMCNDVCLCIQHSSHGHRMHALDMYMFACVPSYVTCTSTYM